MKSIRIHSFGDSRELKLEDTPRPSPEAGQVLVAIRSVGVNPVDWKIREGRHARRQMPSFPFTVGQDFAGEVLEAGGEPAGSQGAFDSGDRVFGFANGAYAEFAAVAVADIAHLPEGVGFETGAALPTPGVTAYQLVTQAAGLQSGQTVLIHGAAGAVGAIAVQLARHRGARVAATDLGPDIAYLKELGADQVFDTRRERFEDAGQVDVVLDLVGGDLLRRSYALVRPGGIVVTTLGQVDEEEAKRRGIRAVALVMRRSAVDLASLAALVEQGVLRTRIAKVLTLPEAQQAQDLSQSGETHGKIILRVA